MEWTREKTLLLISEYRCRRGLWDMTCDEYRKKDVKQRLLSEVSQVLGGNIPVNELEKKFHTLRTQYHREISRMKRKEPYNSKWFGFKNLVFLSSPYACRSTKGRLKTELQADDRKFGLGEGAQDNNSENSTAANNTSSNMNEEYLRKSHASSRAQELEKLIEETTKDVDDIDEPELEDSEAKPKLNKELSVRYVNLTEPEEPETIEHHQHQHQTSLMDVESVSFQANESGELQFQSNTTQSNANNSVHVLPTRIIKIQRRDTGHEDSYFEDQHTHHQLHPPVAKRLYFETNTTPHNTTTILSPTLEAPANGTTSTVLTTSSGIAMSNLRLPKVNTSLPHPPKPAGVAPIPSPPSPTIVSLPPARDEFATYGEYVANEMRAIGNRELLIALKHKINTAIFEANMAELHK
ncbi:hypothetical protein KR009_010965 [Drosophila setifemur]|nr:hypothetical protein KR009_010965 [Drosophila setifemur]